MLKNACRLFRRRFEPAGRAGRDDAHRRSCRDCDAYAESLEAAAADVGRRALPADLRDRLRAIPQQVAVCRDVDRLYAATRRQAAGRPADPAAAQHLAACERCRSLYGALKSALAEEPPPPSPGLIERLKHIARWPPRWRTRPSPLPVWIRDVRYAAVACYLLAALLLSLAGDAAANLHHAAGEMGSRASAWVEDSGARGRDILETLATGIAETFQKSREKLARYGESWQQFFQETIYRIGATEWGLILTREFFDKGESDGKSVDESV